MVSDAAAGQRKCEPPKVPGSRLRSPLIGESRSELARNLGCGGAATGVVGVSGGRRGAIISPQIVLALVPLCGAGLLIRSPVRLQEVEPGFAAEQRLTLSLFAPKRRRLLPLTFQSSDSFGPVVLADPADADSPR
jgi:hypothetical protein